jgi:hypothetical protein
MKNIITKIKDWYRGEYIPPENDPDSPIFRVLGHYKQPLLAKVFKQIGKFWLNFYCCSSWAYCGYY